MKRRGFFGVLVAIVGGALGWRGVSGEEAGREALTSGTVNSGATGGDELTIHTVEFELVNEQLRRELWVQAAEDAADRGILITSTGSP